MNQEEYRIKNQQQQQQDRALLDDFQREIVSKMRERLQAPDLENADLCKFADKCVAFQKEANDREKNTIARDRVTALERRTDAMYHIAQGRNDNRLEIARLRAESARRRPDHPQVDEYDDEAPWGRKKDGTPYTHEEFKTSLNEAIRDIWGLRPIDPNSYMPWEMKRAPDGTLVAPGDPDTSPAKADSAPDQSNYPPDDPDDAPDGDRAGARILSRTASHGNPFPCTLPDVGGDETRTCEGIPNLESARKDSRTSDSP